MGEINVKAKKPVSNYTTSIIFLIIVIIGTIALYIYNGLLDNKLEKIKNDITTIENSISSIEKNQRLQIYSLLELNKETISTFEKMNKVTDYILHLNYISSVYNLKMDGFDLSKWEIKTVVTVKSDKDSIAYQKTKDFISNYRLDEKAKFELMFIDSVEWMDNLKFKTNFKIK